MILFLMLLLSTWSCKRKEPMPVPVTSQNAGFFIVNEGNYTWGNSSLTFVDETEGTSENQVFFRANNAPLGDVAYAMYLYGGSGFVTINNSGRIYRIDPYTYKHTGTLQGLVSPRQILFLNSTTALISDLYQPSVTVFNPATLTITGAIATGFTTEGFAVSGNRIFITCWSFQNKVLVLDRNSLAVTDTLTTGVQPRWIKTDRNGTVWVLCDGGYPGNPAGYEKPSFYNIDSSLHITRRIEFPSAQYATYGFDMNPARDSLFVLYNGVSAFSVHDSVFPAQQLVTSNGRNFYSIAINPSGSRMVLTDAANFSSDGKVYIYTASGQLIRTFTTGINPGWICFR
jgi:hypothetical protein